MLVVIDWSSDVFFFKQKTAYEMCGRDWSSDVCSSDLSPLSLSLSPLPPSLPPSLSPSTPLPLPFPLPSLPTADLSAVAILDGTIHSKSGVKRATWNLASDLTIFQTAAGLSGY